MRPQGRSASAGVQHSYAASRGAEDWSDGSCRTRSESGGVAAVLHANTVAVAGTASALLGKRMVIECDATKREKSTNSSKTV
jgi:hypothetical protein